MPLTLVGGATIASDNAFQARVALGFYFVARQVLSEPESTVGSEKRVRYARAVITQDYNQFLQLSAVIVTDPDIVQALPSQSPAQSAITDGMIVNAISTAWNRLAGVEV